MVPRVGDGDPSFPVHPSQQANKHCKYIDNGTGLTSWYLAKLPSIYPRTNSLLAYVNKAKFWVDSWHPYLFISKNFTDQEKNGCQFFH